MPINFNFIAVLSCCALAAACGRASASRFPIGIYNVGDPKHLKNLSEDGFDSFYAAAPDAETLQRLSREARKRGMRMITSPHPFRQGPVSQTRGWPMDAWYLQDEPDVNGTSAETLADWSAAVRKWDPERLQTFVIGQGAAAAKYGKIADILMLDWYPVPHLKLESVAQQIDLAYSHMPRGKPLWMVIQAFDWREEKQRDPGKPVQGRFPTHAEIRLMSYQAVVHGAKGLFYFRLHKPSGGTLFDAPELWQAVARVSREIKALQPILEKGKVVQLPYAPYINSVEARTWHYRGRDYAIVLNGRGDVLRKIPDEFLSGRWRPLFETRRDPRDLLKKVGSAWYLPPYRVLVFEGRFHFKHPPVRTW